MGETVVGLRVGVIGATGLVGREILGILSERAFPISDLHLYASAASAGTEIEFAGEPRPVEGLSHELPDLDLAFLCATAAVSHSVASDLVAGGATVIDLSSAHRARADVPLVLAGWRPPENLPRGSILAVPDAPTVLLFLPLRALGALSAPRRVIATVLLSASAFGRDGIQNLGGETVALLNLSESDTENRRPVAFSCVPEDLGEAGEETRRVAGETIRDLRRLLGLDIPLTITVVRTPTFHGHGVSVSVETEEPITFEAVRGALRESPSILLDENDARPTSTREVAGRDGIYMGAIRVDSRDQRWIHFWAAADNLRQGAGLNAVTVAEAILRWRSLNS